MFKNHPYVIFKLRRGKMSIVRNYILMFMLCVLGAAAPVAEHPYGDEFFRGRSINPNTCTALSPRLVLNSSSILKAYAKQNASRPKAAVSDRDSSVLMSFIIKATKVKLGIGPVLWTSLDESKTYDMVNADSYAQVKSDDKGRGLSYINVTPEKLGNYTRKTRLEDINKNFSVDEYACDLAEEIITRLKNRPEEIITVLDWGCGDGDLLDDIAAELQKREGPAVFEHVALIGFADMFSPEWKYKSRQIKFILDDMSNLSRYFADQSVDIMYSYLGIMHPDSRDYKRHMLEMLPVFRKDAHIIHDYHNADLKTGTAYFLRNNGFHVQVENIDCCTSLFIIHPLADIDTAI